MPDLNRFEADVTALAIEHGIDGHLRLPATAVGKLLTDVVRVTKQCEDEIIADPAYVDRVREILELPVMTPPAVPKESAVDGSDDALKLRAAFAPDRKFVRSYERPATVTEALGDSNS